ncbi:uncharacterized protein si:ch211-269k10.4 isoform X1 [Oreochromis aureus]|uniref:uncharacterized protein si:ch211-269k10.4 isoform X1 n=1 Tax=Oreochromis aureus TaxID=47969 RepID=UPI0019538267|nr:uncharacterized protein si:ch211-269k10.4 isoform X1 [Oreochromis aureus]
MACADVDMDIHDEDDRHRGGQREQPVVRYYQASEMIPDKKGPLHDLMQKHPAVLGSLQMVSGLLSIGVGIVFAATQEIHESLFSLFRVSQLSGSLFIIAGIVSNLLFKYPALLSVCLTVNGGCIIVAVLAVLLISVDLARWDPQNEDHLRQMEILELCVLGLEVSLSAVLCFWFSKEKRAKNK